MKQTSENNTESNGYQKFKSELNQLAGISFGIFLFILFFQPFNLNKLPFNDQLLFIAGLGAIVFILMVITRYLLSDQIHKLISGDIQLPDNLFYSGLGFVILNSIAFTFFLRYVGGAETSFYLVFKIFLLSLAPPLILNIKDIIRDLKNQNKHQREEIRQIQQQLKALSNEKEEHVIEFMSLNSSEKIKVPAQDVIMIRSADNYVEIFYEDEDELKRKMLRNTLKNIEYQLNYLPGFLRSHRTSIVNIQHAKELNRKYNSYYLDLNKIDEPVPVSRQNLVRIKEALQ